MRLLQIEIGPIEQKFLAKRFTNHREEFYYRKFYKLLDIKPPDDFADPELLFDTLPQPFRMICKVMEEDILEAAWNQIVAREEAGTIAGAGTGWKKGMPKGTKGTKARAAYPTFNYGDLGFVTAQSASTEGDRIFVGNGEGKIFMLNPLASSPIAQEEAFPDHIGGVKTLAFAAGRTHAQAARKEGGDLPLTVAVAANVTNKLPKPPPEVDEEGQPIPPEVNPEDEEEPKPGSRVLVYEVWSESIDDSPMLTKRCQVNLEGVRVCHLEISSDAKYLAVTTEENTVLVYELPEPSIKPDPKVEEEKRKEEERKRKELAKRRGESVDDLGGEDGGSDEEGGAVGEDGGAKKVVAVVNAFPPPVLELTEVHLEIKEPSKEAPEKKEEDPVDPPPAKDSKKKKGEPEAPVGEAVIEEVQAPKLPAPNVYFTVMASMSSKASDEPSTNGLVVARIGSNDLSSYSLGPTALGYKIVPPKPKEPPPEVVLDKKGKKVPPKAGKVPVDEKQGEDNDEPAKGGPGPLSQWKLPSDISCTGLDSSTALMTIGLTDGAVLLWDLAAGMLKHALGRHEKRVNSVAMHGSQYVVSGSDDELYHIYDLGKLSSGPSDNPFAQAGGSRHRMPPPVAPRRLQLRADSNKPILHVACCTDLPVVLCVDSDLCMRMYDLTDGSLVGELAATKDGSWVPLLTFGLAGKLQPSLCCRGGQISYVALGEEEHDKFSSPDDAVVEALLLPSEPEAEDENGDPTDAIPGEEDRNEKEEKGDGEEDGEKVEEVPKVELPSSKLMVYDISDIICTLCPAIANACSGHSKGMAKQLFARTPSVQRQDPTAVLSTFGGFGGGMGGGGNDIPEAAMPTSPAASRASSIRRTRSKKSLTIKRGITRNGDELGAGGGGGFGGLSQAALEGPAKVRQLRAPFFNNTERRAKADAMECAGDRGERERKLVDRRQQLLQMMMPKVG
jgi:WD40 repeat protein